MPSGVGQFKAPRGWASERDARGALLSAVRQAKIDKRFTRHAFSASCQSRCIRIDRRPGWRNWQTQGTQNPPGFGPCGFKSHPRHKAFQRLSTEDTVRPGKLCGKVEPLWEVSSHWSPQSSVSLVSWWGP